MTEPIPPAVQGIIDRLALDPRHVQGVEVGQFLPAFPIAPDVGALVDLRDFGTWLGASNLRYPQFTVILGGVTQPVHEVTQARVVLGRTEPGFPDPVAIADAVRRGATVQILGLEAWHGAARQLCAELQTIGRMRVGAVAFLTGPGEYGLAAHRDDAHVVAVQIAGEKRWELFAPTDTEGGAADTPIADASPIATVSLSPGQALYVPLGCPHRACAGSSGSLHLSFTIRPIALPEAMKALTAPLCSIPSNREHMDGTREERVRQVAELLAAMARWAQRQEPERVVDALEKRWIGSPDGEVDAFADILDTMDSKAGHIAGAA